MCNNSTDIIYRFCNNTIIPFIICVYAYIQSIVSHLWDLDKCPSYLPFLYHRAYNLYSIIILLTFTFLFRYSCMIVAMKHMFGLASNQQLTTENKPFRRPGRYLMTAVTCQTLPTWTLGLDHTVAG